VANIEYLATEMEKLRTETTYNCLSTVACGACLDVGCGFGVGSYILADFPSVTSVVGIDEDVNIKFGGSGEAAKTPVVFMSIDLLEMPLSGRKFDTIVAVNVLEHVPDVDEFIKHVVALLKEDGRLLVSVPNAFSVHRCVGVSMGIIPEAHALGPTDVKVGHRRVFDESSLTESLTKYFRTVHLSGSYYKTLPNSILEELHKKNPELVRAIVGFRATPTHAADLIATAHQPKQSRKDKNEQG